MLLRTLALVREHPALDRLPRASSQLIRVELGNRSEESINEPHATILASVDGISVTVTLKPTKYPPAKLSPILPECAFVKGDPIDPRNVLYDLVDNNLHRRWQQMKLSTQPAVHVEMKDVKVIEPTLKSGEVPRVVRKREGKRHRKMTVRR
jgi:hypothetical protein